MAKTVSFKRLILRAVLRQVSPMVIRLVSVSDHMPLPEFHDVFRIILGWNGDLGYIIRVHGQEFNCFRRKARSRALHEFKLHRQEKFLYVCDTLHMWEWEVRVLDIQDGLEGDHAPVCVGGRGAAPPEFCGGPTGYRLMLKRQREGAAMSDPVTAGGWCSDVGRGLPGSIGTDLGPAPHRAGGGLSEHRSKTARTRTSAT
jgi:hypothetical protein